MMDNIVVRSAEVDDCAQILGLIKELAEYEKMPEKVQLDSKVFRRDGFEDTTKFYHCLVAEETVGTEQGTELCNTRRLVGYVLYFYSLAWEGLNLYMEDIYVSPAYRGKGLGSRLWASILKIGLSEGAQSCRFYVLDWNAPSVAYYKSKGADDVTSTHGLHYLRLNEHQLRELACKPATDSIRPVQEEELQQVVLLQAQLAAELCIKLKPLTVQDLKQTVLSPGKPVGRILVAESAGQLIGYVLFSYAYSTWKGRCLFIEDVYVIPLHRRRGVGRALVQTVAQLCVAEKCQRCDLVTTVHHTSAVQYYSAVLGAQDITTTEGWLLMHMDKRAMADMAAKYLP